MPILKSNQFLIYINNLIFNKMQKVIIAGFVGNDAKLEKGSNGSFTKFSVAVTDRYKDSQGVQTEKTEWYNVTTNSEAIAPFIKKGDPILVEGKPWIGSYEKDGKTNYSFNVRASDITLMAKKS